MKYQVSLDPKDNRILLRPYSEKEHVAQRIHGAIELSVDERQVVESPYISALCAVALDQGYRQREGLGDEVITQFMPTLASLIEKFREAGRRARHQREIAHEWSIAQGFDSRERDDI